MSNWQCMKLSFHSDSPTAPARPMLFAWAAVNRIGLSGTKILGPQEKVTIEEAFRAITIDAAHAMHRENEIGSIEIGKKANFTIFEEDPMTADPKALKDLIIWGTVFEGKPYEITKQAEGLVMSAENQVRLVKLDFFEHRSGRKCHGGACTVNQILQATSSLSQN